jgi:hypothetical protein
MDEVVIVGNFITQDSPAKHVFTLPFGYRPKLDGHFGTVVSHESGSLSAVKVNPSGEVSAYPLSAGTHGLVQMRFPTDQVGEPPVPIQSLVQVNDVSFTATFNITGLTISLFQDVYQDAYIRSIAKSAEVPESYVFVSLSSGSVRVATTVRDVPEADSFVPKVSQNLSLSLAQNSDSQDDQALMEELGTPDVQEVIQSEPKLSGLSYDEDSATISVDLTNSTGISVALLDARGGKKTQDSLPILWFQESLVGPFRMSVTLSNVFGSSDPVVTDPFGPIEPDPVTAVNVTWTDTHAHLSWAAPASGGLVVRRYETSLEGSTTIYQSTDSRVSVPWDTLPLRLVVSTFTRWNLAAGSGTPSQVFELTPPAVSCSLSGSLIGQTYTFRLQADAGGLTVVPLFKLANVRTNENISVTGIPQGIALDYTSSIRLDPDTPYVADFQVTTAQSFSSAEEIFTVPELTFVETGSIQNAFVASQPFMQESSIPDGPGSGENKSFETPTNTSTWIRKFLVYCAKGPDDSQVPMHVKLYARQDQEPYVLLGTETAPFYDSSSDAPWGEQGVDAPPPGSEITFHTTLGGPYRQVKVEAEPYGGETIRVAWQVDYARILPSTSDPEVVLQSLTLDDLTATVKFTWTGGQGGVNLNYSVDSLTLDSQLQDEDTPLVLVTSSYGSHRLRYQIPGRPVLYRDFVTSYNPVILFQQATYDLYNVFVSSYQFPRFPVISSASQPSPSGVVGVTPDGTPLVPAIGTELSETGKNSQEQYEGLPFHTMGYRNSDGRTYTLDGTTIEVRETLQYDIQVPTGLQNPGFFDQNGDMVLSLAGSVGQIYNLIVPENWTAVSYTGGLVSVLPQAPLVSFGSIGPPVAYALDGLPIYSHVKSDGSAVQPSDLDEFGTMHVTTHEYPSGIHAYFIPVVQDGKGFVSTVKGYPVLNFKGNYA